MSGRHAGPVSSWVAESRKALVAAVMTFAGALITSALDGTLTGDEIGQAIGAALASLGVVWVVPNAPRGVGD